MAVRIESVELAQACKSVDLACLTLISDAHQLYRYMYTDAAPALSASLRETKTARSGALVVHARALRCLLNQTYACTRTLLKLTCTRAFTLRASRRSRTAPVLSASRRVAKTARSMRRPRYARAMRCLEPNLLCTCTNLTLEACESIQPLCVPHVVCDAQQLYADAAPVLSASIGV